MNIRFEDKVDNGYNDITYEWYIESLFSDYRLTLTFVGGVNEEEEIVLDQSAFCTIAIYEISAHKPHFMEVLKEKIENAIGDTVETYDETICNTFPEIRSSLYIDDSTSLNSTIDKAQKFIEQLAGLLEESPNQAYTIDMIESYID